MIALALSLALLCVIVEEPTVSVEPACGTVVDRARVSLVGTVSEPFLRARVGDRDARRDGAKFTVDVTLQRGENILPVVVETVAGESIEVEHRLWYCVDDWDRVIAEIADLQRSPEFRGLRLARQAALKPLRRDSQSGRWEFLVADTGDAPQWQGDDAYRLSDRFGIILVLLPPGAFRMGAVGPGSRGDEGPEHMVRLDAFYIAKYELTQAQWEKLAGDNPSYFHAGHLIDGEVMTPRHPVEKVTWALGRRKLAAVGLRYPTEAQWEYACRAGTTTLWSFGDDVADLPRYGNVFDQSVKGKHDRFEPEAFHDGHPNTAPVGSYQPNPNGLYDMHGNVWEWCEDGYRADAYSTLTPRQGDGLREVADAQERSIRSGSYYPPARDSRSPERAGCPDGAKARGVGIRPVLLP